MQSLAAGILGIALAAGAAAQSFEVASIKVSKDVDPGGSVLRFWATKSRGS